ncbi:hypothetical protein B0I35DRAFT_508080 [Stachybotrys elegans]|uniref:DUF7357 domain-containing protein n=1 Tax=Stachybotrys elegans TaxID=80388 RepID=A0A8K0SZK6_9HYPO|nr:hypothetical protein B0I35DRAFT_508080 [Stachybotrys elegans]
MSAQDIRLRLVIRRHAVPEVKLVWPCTATDDLTISGLLSQVNEVVPLESGEWGLEDYAVELSDGHGSTFECLHFQQIKRIFKHDDQVIIRALLSGDLKRRRLSGRHQISADGKHLVDGLAFGRPWLKAPRDRPPMVLPPRKRPRLEYDSNTDDADEQDDEDGEEPHTQLLLEGPRPLQGLEAGSVGVGADFYDADQDDDFSPDEALDDVSEQDADELGHVDEDLEEEVELLKQDNGLVDEEHASEPPNPSDDALADPISSIKAGLGRGTMDISFLDSLTALRAAFPLTPVTTIEAELLRQHKNIERAYEVLAEANDPALTIEETIEDALSGWPPHASSPALENASLADLLPGSKPAASRPLIQEVEETIPEPEHPLVTIVSDAEAADEDGSSSSSSSESDDDGSSDDSDKSEENKGGKAKVARKVLATGSEKADAASSDDSSSDDSSSDDSSSDDSSSEDSSSDDDSSKDSDSSDDGGGASVNKGGKRSKDSDSEDSDSSDSDSAPEERSSKPVSSASKKRPLIQIVDSQEIPKDKSSTNPPQEDVQPRTGLGRTQKRNARRRAQKQARKEKESQNSSVDVAAEDQELLARKQALLSAMAEDNHEEEVDTSGRAEAPAVEEQVQTTPAITDAAEKSAEATTDSPKRQPRRLDLSAGRRILFGALGLRNPKTKDDEDKLRNSMMKGVRPLQNARLAEEAAQKEKAARQDAVDEDPDAWRAKIIYRAVECCHEGIVLSEPPFPFVQRWDPQQKYGSMRKRKRRSQAFDQDDSYYDNSYYDDSWYDASQMHEEEPEAQQSSKRPRTKRSAASQANDIDVELNYDDVPAKPLAGDSQYTEPDDLPALPDDVTALPLLQAGGVRTGMVITWKQLLMSKATNWQPQVASMTGLVLSDSTPDDLHVVLAKRDRENDEKLYDEVTGQRIYEKFEAPDLDEDEADDDGHRHLAWNEMMEPRILQREPSPEPPAEPPAGNPAVEGQDPDSHEATEHAMETKEVQTGASNAEGHDSEESIFMQDGQAIHRYDLPPSGDDPVLSVSVESWGNRQAATDNRANSPTRQLQETSQQAAANRRLQSAELGEPGATVEQASEPADVDMSDMQTNSMLLELESTGDQEQVDGCDASSGEEEKEQEKSEVPVSQLSIPSGRQPPSGVEMGDSLDHGDGSIIPETLLDAGDDLPRPDVEENGGVSSRSSSSSPFPSIEEIFHTATTSRKIDAAKSAARVPKLEFNSDPAYDEAMRRLDEGEEPDSSPSTRLSARRLFPNSTQPAPFLGSLEEPGEQNQTPPQTKKRAKPKRTSPFKVPEGSQVVTLLSSPPSGQVTEHNADEDVDEMHLEKAKLPQGPGWVKKHIDSKNGAGGKLKKKKSMPFSATAGQTKQGKMRRKRSII